MIHESPCQPRRPQGQIIASFLLAHEVQDILLQLIIIDAMQEFAAAPDKEFLAFGKDDVKAVGQVGGEDIALEIMPDQLLVQIEFDLADFHVVKLQNRRDGDVDYTYIAHAFWSHTFFS